MGAVLITDRARGTSMKEAYNNAVEQAVYEYGNDTYNGTISTTRGFEDHTTKFRRSGKTLSEYRDWLYENNMLQKWSNAVGICITEPIVNNNKIKTQVNTTPQKGTRNWITVFQVRLRDGSVVGKHIHQTEAIKIARAYTEKTKERTYVHITKKLESDKTLVSEISYKKSDQEKEGTYEFIALAAE
jgi:hypothetical protein